jgi:Ca2+-binding EF-hand superfamily protein
VKKPVLFASSLLVSLASGAAAQNAGKPVSRADYMKSVDSRFAMVDTNHDGKISKEEMVAQQQRDLEQARANLTRQLEAKFRQLDTNKDGQLSMQEFMAAAPPLRTAETPEQLLQKFDTNHDGKVSADEFRGPELTRFNKIDANHDGIVTPDEIRAAAGQK